MTGESETSVQGMPEQRALRYIDLSRTKFATDAASLLSEETARRYRAVPIERRGEVALIAVSSPANPLTMEALREGAGCDVTTVVASPDQVTTAIAYLYGGGSRNSRRRGQHVAADAADGPVFDTVRFASSEALLADPGMSLYGSDGDTSGDAATLEESLRNVLVPPDADRHLPMPEIPTDGSEDPELEEGTDEAVATSDGPGDRPSANGTAKGVVANGSSTKGVSAGSSANGAPAKGAATSGPTVKGASANGASANGASANGASANGASANGTSANGASANGASANGASANGASANGSTAKRGTGATHAESNGKASSAAPPEPVGPSDVDPGGGPPEGSVADAGPQTNGHAGSVSTAHTPGSDLAPMENHSNPAREGTASRRERTPHAGSEPHVQGGPPVGAHAAAPAEEAIDEQLASKPMLASQGPAETGAPPPPPPGFGSVDLDPAVEAAAVHWPPLARVLVRAGKVSFDQMVQALRAHREAGEPLARYLFSQKLATEDDLVQAMAEEVGLEYIDLTAYPVDPNVAALIPPSVARRHMVLPLRLEDGVPVVAMANPTDVFAMDDLRSIMGRNFTPVVATRSQIDLHLRQLQESSGGDVQEAAQNAAGAASPAGGGFELESLQSVVEDAPIVRYVNLLVLQALNERASDIHIEPTPKRLRIRFRIDGVMHDASSASPAIHQAVISRLKVLGEMDITEHRVPQEGRVSVSVGDRQIDLRLAILPSQYGETCVMRLLDKSASIRRLSELGFFTDTLERYATAYNHPYGVILVTGPTGAGKTTTLYATLQEVMSSEKSVVTVEDPVEYQIDGITQVQINAKVGLHFSTALRSILRADPDIILVGEIRDIETASIAMEAALSGHLVLSTLHTNTAAGTPLRLTEMGIEPFLVTSAVGGVLTQRLARVLCERCKTPYSASLTDFYAAGYREVDLEGLDVSTLYRAAGCRTCSHTGYHGRMLLAEVMPITEEIERMIIEQQSIVAIERQAVEQGMRTLRQDGLRKALAGFTTLEEVLRVVV